MGHWLTVRGCLAPKHLRSDAGRLIGEEVARPASRVIGIGDLSRRWPGRSVEVTRLAKLGARSSSAPGAEFTEVRGVTGGQMRRAKAAGCRGRILGQVSVPASDLVHVATSSFATQSS